MFVLIILRVLQQEVQRNGTHANHCLIAYFNQTQEQTFGRSQLPYVSVVCMQSARPIRMIAGYHSQVQEYAKLGEGKTSNIISRHVSGICTHDVTMSSS